MLLLLLACGAPTDARTWHQVEVDCGDTGAPAEVDVPAVEPSIALCCVEADSGAEMACEGVDGAAVACAACDVVKVSWYE